MRNSRGAQVMKLRAFVAGTGDVRRIQTIVSEEFSEKKLLIPAVSVLQAGALPMEGAQVILEAAVAERKAVNPAGVVFFSGQQVAAEGRVENTLQPVLPLVETSLANLQKVADGTKVPPAAMLRVTCLVSSLADFPAVQQRVVTAFPQAAVTIIQLQRGPLRSVAECEGVGRLSSAPSVPVELVNPAGVPGSPNYSQAAMVSAPRLLFTGEQLAFGQQDADVKLAFDRLGRVLTAGKSLWSSVFWTSYYPLTNPVSEKIRAARFSYLDKSRPPASTLILFEGLPSLDASFGMEVVAAAN
jgi:enamine deaminase RidA (YjgF/YER057c/UK114 family)